MMIPKTRKIKPSISAHSTAKELSDMVYQAKNVALTTKKLLKHGDKGPNGYILGHETCPFFHPKMRKNYLSWAPGAPNMTQGKETLTGDMRRTRNHNKAMNLPLF